MNTKVKLAGLLLIAYCVGERVACVRANKRWTKMQEILPDPNTFDDDVRAKMIEEGFFTYVID